MDRFCTIFWFGCKYLYYCIVRYSSLVFIRASFWKASPKTRSGEHAMGHWRSIALTWSVEARIAGDLQGSLFRLKNCSEVNLRGLLFSSQLLCFWRKRGAAEVFIFIFLSFCIRFSIIFGLDLCSFLSRLWRCCSWWDWRDYNLHFEDIGISMLPWLETRFSFGFYPLSKHLLVGQSWPLRVPPRLVDTCSPWPSLNALLPLFSIFSPWNVRHWRQTDAPRVRYKSLSAPPLYNIFLYSSIAAPSTWGVHAKTPFPCFWNLDEKKKLALVNVITASI